MAIRQKALSTLENYFTDYEMDKIFELFNKITSTSNIESTFDKASRFVENDIKPENKDSHGKYIPAFKRLDIVHCSFTGVGFEWDSPHYAVVWQIDNMFDAVEVIPLTSKKRDEFKDVFSVGKVQGLPKKEQSTLLLSDKTRVSRKRLNEVKFDHPKWGLKNVSLSKIWEDRIFNGIVATELRCDTIGDLIELKCGLAMLDNLPKFKELQFKAVIEYEYDKVSYNLKYRIWNKKSFETAQLVVPIQFNSTRRDEKNRKIKWLNSKFPALRSIAKQYFKDVYGI